MSCAAVRDRLAERALGMLAPAEATPLERHIAWCAACRREAEGLVRAAGSLGFAPAPVQPDPQLEDRIVDAVRHQVVVRRPSSPRRGRLGVAAVLAAMLALSGLGWGAVMAGRAARLEARVREEQQRQGDSIQQVRTIFQSLEFSDGRASAGSLSSPEGIAGGAGMTVTSGSIRDIAIVLVTGLGEGRAPYRVELTGRGGLVLLVGRIRQLDADGGATLIQRFGADLRGFRQLVVRDAKDRVVLRGMLDSDAGLVSPSPSPDPSARS